MIKLSADKKPILKKLLKWVDSEKPKKAYITLGGYAGTGKTTLISVFRKILYKKKKKVKVAFVSFTGKAARVLKYKIKKAEANYKGDFIGTIHSLIYSPVLNSREEIVGWDKKDDVEADLIIIDEASMVDRKIWNDLLSYKIPILAVGDHGQLPPISGNFNLMEDPMLRLEKIHRQIQDNPIIKLSILAREKGEIPFNEFSPTVKKIKRHSSIAREEIEELLAAYNEDTLILSGYNNTRIKLNKFVRQALEFQSPTPEIRDRVICLRNNPTKEIYNGMLGTIVSMENVDQDWYFAEIEMDGEEKLYKGLISVKQFNNKEQINFTKKRSKVNKGDLFDFGYALTVHKAQGSQAKRVILFEERFKQMDDEMWKRWLYTAVTRAEKELYIIA
ncbi:AAA family ATPase [Candidatus Dojkabacteria bacterium]|nr:AAA family ATPase [Candidatus Dojkabacteria bacterium]